MKFKQVLIAAAFITPLLLSGCKSLNNFMDGKQPSDTGATTNMSDVPVVSQESVGTTPTAPANTRPSLVIYASASSAIEGYTLVEQKDQQIYVDPRQTLLRADLNNVIAVQDVNGRPLLNLHFSTAGAQKLQSITSNNIGRSLTVTYKNELLSILNINAANNTGVLNVPMGSAEDASRIEQEILDGD